MLLLIVASCIERYDLFIPAKGSKYVVEATLLDDERFQFVRLAGINRDGNMGAVSGAAMMFEEASGRAFQLVQAENGRYLPTEPLEIVTGEQYRLVIGLGDSVQIVSEWETVPVKVEIAAGRWEQFQSDFYNLNGIPIRRSGINFYVDTGPASSDHNFLRWEYETTHINEAPYSIINPNCYIRTVPDNFVNSHSIINSSGKPLKEHLIDFISLDKRFSFRLTMLVRQITLSQSAGMYYEHVERQQLIKGTVFDPPAGSISSNLSLGDDTGAATIYGLFEVGRLDEHTITVYRGDLEAEVVTYVADCQAKFVNNVPAPECSNCSAEPGAGPRPYYF